MANRKWNALLLGWLIMCWASVLPATAKTASDHTQIGHNINIGPNEEAGELTCVGCSIHVRGHVAGDVTAVGGSVVIEDNGQVAGDLTVVGGNVRLDPTVSVAGDVTVFAGQIRRDPEAKVSGDVTVTGGRGWLVPLLLVPLVVLGLLVTFIVWLIQRIRHNPASSPA